MFSSKGFIKALAATSAASGRACKRLIGDWLSVTRFPRVLFIGCLGLTLSFAMRAHAELSEIDIQVKQTAVNNGPPGGYTEEIDVHGSDIQSISVTPPAGGAAVTMTPDSFDVGRWSNNNVTNYPTMAAVLSDYPVGDYTFSIRYLSGALDTKTLTFDATEPDEFPKVSSPAPGATDVQYAPAPTFVWNPVSHGSGFGCDLSQANGQKVADAHPLPIGNTSWAPSIDLQSATSYYFDLSLAQLGSTGFAGIDQTTDQGDSFQYFGIVMHTDTIDITTAAPEPAALALLAVAGFPCCLWWWRKRRAM
jgi:hypothetical protein